MADLYVVGKLLLIDWLYPDKKYTEMETQVQSLLKLIEKLRIPDERKQQLLTSAGSKILYAKQGQAIDALLKGDLAKARALTDPAVEEIKKGAVDERYVSLSRSLVLINLRANVQDGKLDRAQELLALLQKADPNDTSGSGILTNLVKDLREQIAALREEIAKLTGEQRDAAKTQLEKTKTSFSAFLDVLGKQKNLPPRNVLFIADSYSSLDNHKAALAILDSYKSKLTEPKEPVAPRDVDIETDPKKGEKYKQEVQEYKEKLGMIHFAQIMRVREMRLMAKGMPAEEREPGFKAAMGEIEAILKSEWGKGHLEARKERVQVLEDWERYPEAARGWDEIMRMLKPRITADTAMKEQYYECFYHVVYCKFMNGTKLKDARKQANQIKSAAGDIVKLEGAQPNLGSERAKKQYEQLLADNPELKKAYIAGGGKMLLSAADLAQAPKPEDKKDADSSETKKDDKKASGTDSKADTTARLKLYAFIGAVLLGLGLVGFAFFKWIKS
jgi:hypothetical protein